MTFRKHNIAQHAVVYRLFRGNLTEMYFKFQMYFKYYMVNIVLFPNTTKRILVQQMARYRTLNLTSGVSVRFTFMFDRQGKFM